VNPTLLGALPGRPTAWLSLLLAIAGMVAVFVRGAQRRPLAAFLGSCAFLAGMLAATAACLYPVMLRATGDPALSLTAPGGGTSAAGLRAALGWWTLGIPFVIAYFALLFRIHRGKVVAAAEGEGY
jgi:cytochrome bd ubiquinol oxidase subunit II